MAFVQDEVEEVELQQLVDVTSGLFIRGYQNVQLAVLRSVQRVGVARVDRALDVVVFEKLLDFFVPLVSQCVGADHQAERSYVVVLLVESRLVKDNGETLDCFAEAHLVAQAAVEAISTKLPHPVDPLLLVVSELGVRHDGKGLNLSSYAFLREHSQEVKALLQLVA